jgi:CBS domain-containing protein
MGTETDAKAVSLATAEELAAAAARGTRVTRLGARGGISEVTHHAAPDLELASDEERAHSPRRPTRADRTALWQVMARDVVCVPPDLDAELLRPLLDALDALPVVDPRGAPVGVVSRSDLRRLDGTPAATAADVMTCLAFTLAETATLSQAAALMAYEHVQRVLVVSTDGRLVGSIAALDIVRWLAHHDGYLVPDPHGQPRSLDAVATIVAAAIHRKGHLHDDRGRGHHDPS